MAQLGRALRSGRRGRRFKSCHSDFRERYLKAVYLLALGFFIFLKHIRKLFKIFYILPGTKNVTKNRPAGNQVLLNSTQLISFLKNAETMKGTDEYNDIEDKQGDIFMENFFEPETECKTEQVGCPTMGYQDVNVCVPVTIKAFEIGRAHV